MNLHQAVREYGQWRIGDGGYSLNTWAGEAPGLLAFADHADDYGITEVHQLSYEFVSDWWKDVRARVGIATAPTRMGQLRSFLTWSMRKGWMSEDPTVLIRAPRPAPEPRQRLTAEEILRLVDGAWCEQHRVILALCGNLGLRASEIQTLHIRDLDLDAMTLMVRVHKTRETPPDPMPLTQELAAELSRWLTHYRNHPTRRGPLTAATLLIPSQHHAPTSGTITYRTDRSIGDPEDVVKQALERTLGWASTKGEGIHTLRRSFARIFFDSVLEEEGDRGFDEALLGTMRLLHHERPETTLTYIGVDRQIMARDKFMRGQPILTRHADRSARRHLRAVQ